MAIKTGVTNRFGADATAHDGRRRVALVGVTLAATLLAGGLSACSDDDNKDNGQGTASAGSGEITPQQRLDSARKQLDDSPSVRINVTSEGVPDDVTGVRGAEGVLNHAPAFSGKVTGKFAGQNGTFDVVAIESKVFVKVVVWLDLTAQLGGVDPAKMFDKDTGLTSLLGKTVNPAYGERKRDGEAKVVEVKGQLPGQPVVDLLHTGKADGTFDVSYWLDEQSNQLKSVRISGPFQGDAVSSYTVALSSYGETVEIKNPKA